MKNVWNVVFAFLFLLPLVGCEEECGGNSNEDEFTSPEEHIADAHVLFFDSHGEPMIPVKVELASPDSLEYREILEDGDWEYMTTEPGYITILPVSKIMPVYHVLHFFGESEEKLLRVIPEVININDCDESALFRFYYEGGLVHTCTLRELKDGFRLNI